MGATTRLKCPHCNRKSSTPQQLGAGTKVRCPACHEVFNYVPESDVAELTEFEPLPSPTTGPLRPEVLKPGMAPPQQPVQPPRGLVGQVIRVSVRAPRKGNAVAVAALVLGIIAALICWVPFLGLLCLPVGLLGMLLGFIGFALALVGRRSGFSSSLVGTGTSLASIVLALLITGRTASVISESLEKQSKEERTVATPIVDSHDEVSPRPRTESSKVAATQPPPIKKELSPTADRQVVSSPTVVAEANKQTGQAESEATLGKIEETFKKRGMPLTTRQAIYRALCLAEARAQWEADRLYPMIDHWQENMRYYDGMAPKYEKPIYDKYHLTEDENLLISTEAIIRKWRLPEKSALDHSQLARGMKVEVYANRGDHTYHRKGCALLDKERPIVSLSLYEATSNRTGRPCNSCAP